MQYLATVCRGVHVEPITKKEVLFEKLHLGSSGQMRLPSGPVRETTTARLTVQGAKVSHARA